MRYFSILICLLLLHADIAQGKYVVISSAGSSDHPILTHLFFSGDSLETMEYTEPYSLPVKRIRTNDTTLNSISRYVFEQYKTNKLAISEDCYWYFLVSIYNHDWQVCSQYTGPFEATAKYFEGMKRLIVENSLDTNVSNIITESILNRIYIGKEYAKGVRYEIDSIRLYTDIPKKKNYSLDAMISRLYAARDSNISTYKLDIGDVDIFNSILDSSEITRGATSPVRQPLCFAEFYSSQKQFPVIICATHVMDFYNREIFWINDKDKLKFQQLMKYLVKKATDDPEVIKNTK